MNDNKELKILDELLTTLLVSNSVKHDKIINETIYRCQYLENVEQYTFQMALLKLSKDDYVMLTNINVNEPIKSDFRISFEGIVFNKNGGYEKQNKKNLQMETEVSEIEKRQSALESKNTSLQYQLVVLTYLIAFGTLLSSIYYLLEVLAFFGVLQSKKI